MLPQVDEAKWSPRWWTLCCLTFRIETTDRRCPSVMALMQQANNAFGRDDAETFDAVVMEIKTIIGGNTPSAA